MWRMKNNDFTTRWFPKKVVGNFIYKNKFTFAVLAFFLQNIKRRAHRRP